MNGITLLEALMAEIEPYTAASVVCTKALNDAGCDDVNAPYTTECKTAVTIAAVYVLKKFVVLSGESVGKSSQSYNVEQLKRRIRELCNDANLDADGFLGVPSVSDGSMYW